MTMYSINEDPEQRFSPSDLGQHYLPRQRHSKRALDLYVLRKCLGK